MDAAGPTSEHFFHKTFEELVINDADGNGARVPYLSEAARQYLRRRRPVLHEVVRLFRSGEEYYYSDVKPRETLFEVGMFLLNGHAQFSTAKIAEIIDKVALVASVAELAGNKQQADRIRWEFECEVQCQYLVWTFATIKSIAGMTADLRDIIKVLKDSRPENAPMNMAFESICEAAAKCQEVTRKKAAHQAVDMLEHPGDWLRKQQGMRAAQPRSAFNKSGMFWRIFGQSTVAKCGVVSLIGNEQSYSYYNSCFLDFCSC
jgi:hypothetical protein